MTMNADHFHTRDNFKIAGKIIDQVSALKQRNAELEKENAKLKTMAMDANIPTRTCRNCGRNGTLMYMPVVKDENLYWELYNNKGADFVFGIVCAHCGEVAFITKQMHEFEVEQLQMKISSLEKLVETADKLLPNGGFTIKDIKFGGVKLEGIKCTTQSRK